MSYEAETKDHPQVVRKPEWNDDLHPRPQELEQNHHFPPEAIMDALEGTAHWRTGDTIGYRMPHLVYEHGGTQVWDQGDEPASINMLDPVLSTGQALDDEDPFWQRLRECMEQNSEIRLMD